MFVRIVMGARRGDAVGVGGEEGGEFLLVGEQQVDFACDHLDGEDFDAVVFVGKAFAAGEGEGFFVQRAG